MNKMIIDVSVATLWVSPSCPREIDTPALENPVQMNEWIAGMTTEDKLGLSNHNLLETQALYGTVVHVIEEAEDWVKVIVPEQSTSKEDRGYPGWVPKKQLAADDNQFSDLLTKEIVVVTVPTTYLYDDMIQQGIEISFLTRLPFIEELSDWVKVATPSGAKYLKKNDVAVYSTAAHIPHGTGEQIVETAKTFLGLPYLWAGMSGFGFDCSGFSYSMHRAFGISTPRDAHDQARSGESIQQKDLKPGDMIFFAYQEGKGRIHHVGLYIGNDQMIHSPNTPKSIEITTLSGTNYEKEYCGASRYNSTLQK